jgi:hypothetical protein
VYSKNVFFEYNGQNRQERGVPGLHVVTCKPGFCRWFVWLVVSAIAGSPRETFFSTSVICMHFCVSQKRILRVWAEYRLGTWSTVFACNCMYEVISVTGECVVRARVGDRR